MANFTPINGGGGGLIADFPVEVHDGSDGWHWVKWNSGLVNYIIM